MLTHIRHKASLLLLLSLILAGCRPAPPDPDTVRVAIENSPNSLDPRVGTDAMAERIGSLIFDPLVRKDEHFQMQPWLATSWEHPDSATWIFHLRDGVHFHDGRPLTAADAAWTIQSLLNGSVITSKSGAFTHVASAEATARLTLTIRMKSPDASLLFNLSDGLFGVIPLNSGADFASHPIGSGPFRFVSAHQDRDVILDCNPAYWAGPPAIQHLQFAVVPDAVTVALELEKGSIDIASNELTLDMVHALQPRPGLHTETSPGSPVMYLNFNVERGPLTDPRVRQAIASALDRDSIVNALWLGHAHLADTLLPPAHWAAADPASLARWPYDPARARTLLASAGFAHGLRLEMKCSTDETTRMLAEILQQQLASVGITLTIRSSEFGTFYSDVQAGRFEMYALRWIGSNEDPDIFRYAYASDRFPPRGANRGHYRNPRLNALLASASSSYDQSARRASYTQAQQILANDLPGIPLWFPDNQVVHTARVTGIVPPADGSFDFLRTARLR